MAAVAAIAAEEVVGSEAFAEFGEGEISDAKSAFEKDSGESAALSTEQVEGILKVAQSLLNLGLSINDLVREEAQSKQETKDRTEDRYRTGVLFPKESRFKLIKDGKIPSYFSTINIKQLLNKNILPFGWDEETAVLQGFAPEIRAGEMRKRARDESSRIVDRLTLKRTIKQQQDVSNNLRKKLRLKKTLQKLHTNFL